MDDFLKITTSKMKQKIAIQNQQTLYSNPSNPSGHVIQNFLIGYQIMSIGQVKVLPNVL